MENILLISLVFVFSFGGVFTICDKYNCDVQCRIYGNLNGKCTGDNDYSYCYCGHSVYCPDETHCKIVCQNAGKANGTCVKNSRNYGYNNKNQQYGVSLNIGYRCVCGPKFESTLCPDSTDYCTSLCPYTQVGICNGTFCTCIDR